jgi:hypothetical protein
MQISQQQLNQIFDSGKVPEGFTDEQERVIKAALFAYEIDGNFQDVQDTLAQADMIVVY